MIFANLKEKISTKFNVKEKEFLPAILEVTETPASPLGRLILWVLFAAVIITLLWSFFGYVDEVAVAPGKLIPIGNVKVIQAEDKATVKNIYVKDGDKVQAGQVLVELDETVSAADLARLKTQAAQLQLEMDRLLAEQSGVPFVPTRYDALEQKDIEFQNNIYQTRVNDYNMRLRVKEQEVQQSMAAINSAQSVLEKYQKRYETAVEKESRVEKLVQENAVSMFTLLDQRSARQELEYNINAQQAEVIKAEAMLAQNQRTVQAITTEYQSDVTSKLMDSRKQFMQVSEELKKAERKQRLSKIVSPIDGCVNQLAIHTIGGVVTEAQALMTIVPEDASLEVEAWVANKDIGFVHEGQEAEVKVETFNFQKFGTIRGNVKEVSPDSITDKEKGQVYRVMLTLDKNNVLVNDKFVSLASGMSANADIKIREKRIIEFFLDPFRKYQNEALRER